MPDGMHEQRRKLEVVDTRYCVTFEAVSRVHYAAVRITNLAHFVCPVWDPNSKTNSYRRKKKLAKFK